MPPRDPSEDDLDDLEAVNLAALLSILRALVAAAAARTETVTLTKRLAGWIGAYMGWSFLRGAFRTLEQVDSFSPADREGVAVSLPFPDKPVDIGTMLRFPDDSPVIFREAVADLAGRDPRLAQTAHEVAVHMRSGGFAAAKSASQTTTRKVLDLIRRMEAEGRSLRSTQDAVRALTGWTKAYADTVVKTTASTSYSMGRVAQARRLGPRVAPAFKIIGPVDSIARPNHAAAVGLIASIHDPIWQTHMPPLGYNCRHSISIVPRSVLKRLGLLDENGVVKRYEPPGFAASGPDPGFRSAVRI